MTKQEINGVEYRKWIASKEWKAIRDHKLESTGRKCERCGVGGAFVRLNVHHKTYERIGYESNDDLEVLCTKCHSREHRDTPIEIYYRDSSTAKREDATAEDMYTFNRLMMMRYGDNWQYKFSNEKNEELFLAFLEKKGI